MTRVLIVDDDPLVSAALVSALGRDGFDLVTAGDLARGFEAAVTVVPDIVVLDLGLPDGDGLELLQNLRRWSDVPVLVLSGEVRTARVVDALELGADDYLAKPFGLDELAARLRALLRRGRTASIAAQEADRVEVGDLTVELRERRLTVLGRAVHLTPTEWRILEAFLGHPGRLLTFRWLVDTVWDDVHGEETFASLRSHVKTLRRKLADAADAPRYIETVKGAGYRWIAEVNAAPSRRLAAPEQDAAMGAGELVHQINNAATALALSAHLLRPSLAPGDVRHLDSLSTAAERMVGLVAAVARAYDQDVRSESATLERNDVCST